MSAPRLVAFVDGALEIVTGEYLLTRWRHANGGTIVFLRALHVAIAVSVTGLTVINVVDPDRGGGFSWRELRLQIVEHLPWFGTVFAAAYVAFYARFASQWNYLAGLYNQLKASQARRDANEEVIAEWWAGFLEDCDDLHLLRKPMFASIANGVLTGMNDECERIKRAFDSYSPGGARRRARIAAEAQEAVSKIDRKYAIAARL